MGVAAEGIIRSLCLAFTTMSAATYTSSSTYSVKHSGKRFEVKRVRLTIEVNI